MISMLLKQRDGALIDQLLRDPAVPPEARAYLLREGRVVGEWSLARVAKVVAAYREVSSCISNTD